jgi:hypothetical protein
MKIVIQLMLLKFEYKGWDLTPKIKCMMHVKPIYLLYCYYIKPYIMALSGRKM